MLAASLLYFLAAVSIVLSHKILFLPMPEGPSHRGSMYPLAKTLEERGHDVLIFSEVVQDQKPGPIKEQFVKLKHVDKEVYDSFVGKNSTRARNALWHCDMNVLSFYFPWSFSSRLCSSFLSHQRDEFWKVANQSWDLIFVDSLFAPCGMAISALSDAPYTLMHTLFNEIYVAEYRGLPTLPHLTAPAFPSPKRAWKAKSFQSRLDGVIEYLLGKAIVIPQIQYFVSKSISPVIPHFSFQSYIRNSQASFIEYPEKVNWVTPCGHDCLNVGSHCNLKRTPLPEQLESFVSDPKSMGTILVAFGTMGDWTKAPKDIFDKLYNALALLKDYRIIWQYAGDGSSFASHIKTMAWLPQQDILLHPSTKLFISHGGLKSFKEAVCAEVPVVYLPLWAEQIRNAMMAEEKHFGERLYKKNFTSEEIVEKALKVMTNSMYQKYLQMVKGHFMDQIMPPLNQGAFWVEYIIRHRGLPKSFHRNTNDFYWHQYWNLDVIVVCTFVVVLNFYLAYRVVCLAFGAIRKTQ